MAFTMVGMVRLFEEKKRCQPHPVLFFTQEKKYPCRQFALFCHIGALSGYNILQYRIHKRRKISFSLFSKYVIKFYNPLPLAYHYLYGILLLIHIIPGWHIFCFGFY